MNTQKTLTLLADPFEQFQEWFELATQTQAQFPEAMTLATSTPDGKPSLESSSLRALMHTDSSSSLIMKAAKAMKLRSTPRLLFYFTGSHSPDKSG